MHGFRLPGPEDGDDEVWEELDEEAMEECMILATQMCTGQADESKKKTNTTIQNDIDVKVIHNGDLGDVQSNRNNAANHSGDSGFSSTRGTALDSSRVFHSSVKKKFGNSSANTPGRGNAYADKFSDFNTSANSQKLPSFSRSHPNSGRVYNSIPLKETNNNADGGSLNRTVSCPGTSRDNNTAKLQNSVKVSDGETAKLREEILLMQGEISMLRAELKRKETALAAERLERCTLIDSAEKKGREKAVVATKDAEKKVTECNKTIEKLQDDLHFKKREIEELQTQFHRLEKKMQQQPVSLSQKSVKAMEVSPGKPGPSFKDRFDFGKSSVIVKNMEVQTETSKEIRDERPKLNVKFSRGKGFIGRQIACSLSRRGLDGGEEPLVTRNRWSLDSDWRNVLSKTVLNDGDDDRGGDLQRQLLTISIQRLEEACTIFAPERVEAFRSKDSKNFDAIDVYESHVVPSLSVMKCLTTTKCTDLSGRAVRALCYHLPRLTYEDVAVNDHLWPHVLEAMCQISKLTEQMDKAEYV